MCSSVCVAVCVCVVVSVRVSVCVAVCCILSCSTCGLAEAVILSSVDNEEASPQSDKCPPGRRQLIGSALPYVSFSPFKGVAMLD